MSEKIRTTGKLREILADTISGVISGEVEIDQASAVHKLAKNVSDSLYSETKIRMFEKEIGGTTEKMGDMCLGESID